jgi:uncharacterized circularly permuted ATP-grasp superfamily protein/uncharacterized alpha-E superfamily protein
VLDRLQALGAAELARRWGRARLLLREDGVSYDAYADPRQDDGAWSLSPLPVIVPPEDWASIERGVQQRVRLFEAVLADLYGAQELLLAGLVPPEIVLGNSAYLRPCHGSLPPGASWLPLYAADLVRAPDGRLLVLSDRTQMPVGAGYALENRIVLQRTLPEGFRACNVERLAPYFRAVQEMLEARATSHRDNPRVVLLTPGPYNMAYFEHAYLAQHLGYTLATGGDLTVRDDRVYMKTLGKLLAVDVILRRVDDDLADPLELRADSSLGVPGLVQAARRGQVAIANPLGTGLVQTPALIPYLPALCRYLLGEDLVLSSPRTLWCGDDDALAEAMARPEDLVFKRAFPGEGPGAVFAGELPASALAELCAQVRARPGDHVAQERVSPSTTPALAGDALRPRSMILRCFAVTTARGTQVMRGGLARSAGPADIAGGSGAQPGAPGAAPIVHAVPIQHGADSHDAWVLASGPGSVPSASLVPPAPIALSRGGGDLPSRAADDLYWLGRYTERAEGMARLARVVIDRLQGLGGRLDPVDNGDLVALAGALSVSVGFPFPGDVGGHRQAPEAEGRGEGDGAALFASYEQALLAAVFGERGGTLSSIVHAALRTGRMVRGRISLDTWRVLSSLDDVFRGQDAALGEDPLGALAGTLNQAVRTLAAFAGLVMESMTRGQAWAFLDMGRRLERASALLSLLTVLARRSDRERALLEAILDVADSGMTYRRRYLTSMQVEAVVDLLLTDDGNPRSVLYQVEALARHVEGLPRPDGHAVKSVDERAVVAAQAELQLADIARIVEVDASGARAGLAGLLDRVSTGLRTLSDALSTTYLNNLTPSVAPPRHFGPDSARGSQPPPVYDGGSAGPADSAGSAPKPASVVGTGSEP